VGGLCHSVRAVSKTESLDYGRESSYLAVSLRGQALTVLTNLPAEQRQDYQTLTRALQNRFGIGHQTELNRAKLRSRLRRREETLPALAEDVERLTRLAYPGAAESMISTLAKDQFIDALHDDDSRLRIRQLRPQTLQGALEIALEMESYAMADKQKRRTVRELRLESTSRRRFSNRTGNTQSGKSVLLHKLQECLEALQKQQQPVDLPSRKKEGLRHVEVSCWQCGKKGHYKRDCRQPPAKTTTEQTSTPVDESSSPPPVGSGNDQ